MIKFYKKAALGRMVEATGGSSDPELAEVRMTAKEYHEWVDEIRAARRETESVREEAEDREDEWKRYVKAERARIQQSADESVAEKEKEIASVSAKLEARESELQRERNRNVNLQRIMRERANQARGITPKKNHDGYIVLESRQWTEHYMVELRVSGKIRIGHRSAVVWKSTIQTPYDASLPVNQISDLVESGIKAMMGELNIDVFVERESNGKYSDFGLNDEGYEKNGLYRWQYKANYRTGLWEIEIYTTKSLKIPENRRPHLKAGKKRSWKNKAEDNEGGCNIDEFLYSVMDDE
ncbi:MAG: hypothetical protein IJL20_06085 [Lachnospiraceae bacterium]|nr:hypothetical protein [Lachnospiraceae bacterium]